MTSLSNTDALMLCEAKNKELIDFHSHQSSGFGVYIKFTSPLSANKQTYTPSHPKAKRD